MKKIRDIISIILIVSMVVGNTIPCFCDGNNESKIFDEINNIENIDYHVEEEVNSSIYENIDEANEEVIEISERDAEKVDKTDETVEAVEVIEEVDIEEGELLKDESNEAIDFETIIEDETDRNISHDIENETENSIETIIETKVENVATISIIIEL